MQSASPNNNQWFLAATYDYHDASDLVNGSTSIPDFTDRERTTQSFVLEASRGLTEKWSVSGIMSVVEHRRDVGGVEDVRDELLKPQADEPADLLGRPLGDGLQLPELMKELSSHYLDRALEEANGNKTKAAELVGLPSYQTFTNWLKTKGVRELKRAKAR